ncbi:MAG: hypothetical protein Hyperionvirus12_6 [Hyperionvirus sp.]|uniref:eRF1/Pelota-like N-terminal domain-containing protein n=1 Tax=Hyperionvirus sp. TaxID=2487770 RepID=A0A3G5AEL2_9VIRU|nr:MAG: hypothetical protein Hyperionvirus12_6 [Hyperionvirus sp.]
MEKKAISAEEVALDIERWKLKRLVRDLNELRGEGTSMISLIIPPKGQIALVNHMLTVEMGTASNIKSRVNRLSVLNAIDSTQQKLKLYSRVPTNGLVVFCGMTSVRKISICFEPFKPIGTSLYICDNSFHTEALEPLIAEDEVFGFVIVDGNGALFGKLCGTNREVFHKIVVSLPGKTRRGGQSANRIARIRDEKKALYIKKVVEKLNDIFIQHVTKGIIVAGNGMIKDLVVGSDLLDYRVKPLFLNTIDVAYGGENGFQQAIEMSSDILKNVRYVKEKKLLGRFNNELIRDTGKISYGLRETMRALDSKLVSELIVCETIMYPRNEYVSSDGKEKKVSYQNEVAGKWTLVKSEPLIDWLNENYASMGITLHIITESTSEGNQFSKGFGGIGALLYYKPDVVEEVVATDKVEDEGAIKPDDECEFV